MWQQGLTAKQFSGLKKMALLVSMLALTAACAKEMKLPDDPDSEPAANMTDTTPATPGDSNSEQPTPTPAPSPSQQESILARYNYVDPNHDIDTGLLQKAILYYDTNLSKIANKAYLGVIDFSKRSTLKRFFIIDMKTGAVWGMHVAHGKNSDPEADGYANPDLFSNAPGSEKSSLGVYRAAETYYGEHGLSMRLDGLSPTNSNVRARAIIVHQADYVQEASVIQGRSWGCPAVAPANRDEVIRRLKNGGIIYAGLSGKR
jgi:hypothetical protein